MGDAVTLEHPPHAPERGWARKLLGPLHVTGIFWYRFHRWGISILPDWGVTVFITIFTTFFFVALRRIRAAIASNLEPVLGPCGWLERQRRIFRTMWLFAWCLSERYERLATKKPFRIEADLPHAWEEMIARGCGFVMVTAHVGNFEVGSMLPAMRGERIVHVVREKEVDPRAQQFVQQLMDSIGQAGYRVHFEGSDPLQGMALLEALRGGEIVAVQGDRPRALSRTVAGTLFGRPFELPAGPAALARGGGVPVVPIFVLREGRRAYRVHIRPPLEPRSDRHREAIADLTRAIAAEVEWAIRQAPHQWFCFRTIWPASTSR